MIHSVFDLGCFKVLTIFGASPGSRFGRKELKGFTRLHNTPLDAALRRLLASGVLKREGRLYEVNRENEEGKALVALAGREYRRLKELPFEAYFAVLDVTAALVQHEMWLFGSYAKLVYRKGSDVDIAVLGEVEKNVLEKIITKTKKTYGLVVEFHTFDRTRFYKNKRDPLVKEIFRNGVRLL